MTGATPELDVNAHRMCANCGHVRLEADPEPHFAMPSMGLRCSGRGSAESPIYTWIRPFGAAWDQFVALARARWADCPVCVQRIRVRRNGKLVTHQRPPDEARRRRWIDCSGGGLAVLPAEPPPNLSLTPKAP